MATRDAASSPVPWPPIIYGGGALLCAALSFISPLPLPGGMVLRGLGVVLIIAGGALLFAASREFSRAGTPMPPIVPTTSIVSIGIYRWTRNPMYLGMSLLLFGLGLAFASGWFLLATPIAIAAVNKLAIAREEVYLAGKFGAGYLDYKARVRRWL